MASTQDVEKKDTYDFDRKIFKIAKKIIAPFIKSKFNFKVNALYQMPDAPFVLICNHVTNLDMVFVAISTDKHLYFVSSEHVVRKGIGGKMVQTFFHPIVREKATVGLTTVVEMKKHLTAGHNVGLFAEGVRSADGRSNKIVPSSAAVLKKLGFTVVTFKLHGGFFTSPRWSSDIRRGEMSGELVHIYSPEDIKSMSAEELDTAINNDIYEDAYEYNKDRKIAFKSKKAAEGIEFELVVCPKCKKMATIHSKGSTFYCDCGLKGVYNEYGLLSGEGFSFTTIPEWDEWQKNEIEVSSFSDDEIIVSHPNQKITEISKDHTEKVVGEGDLVLRGNSISVGEKKILFDEIKDCDFFYHGYLLISAKDKKYYEISNPKSKYPGYLYKLLIKKQMKSNINMKED